MQRKLILTEDGSHTLHIPEMNEHYHSTHGAVQESKHVFIEAGLKQIELDTINILEIGLGTGLNAWLTLKQAEKTPKRINYLGIEKYPLTKEEYQRLNYAKEEKDVVLFQTIHTTPWNKDCAITSSFNLKKRNADITRENFETSPKFNLIYFDAFAPNKQSNSGIWTQEIFSKIHAAASDNAILVTYCAQGQVRRDLQAVGFTVERIPGPPGKREMIRATKRQ